MNFWNRVFGFRWSLYIVLNGNQLIYAMHEDSVLRILGYVMGYFAGGGRPVEPWSLHLNFNKRHKAFRLEPEHFTPDGTSVTPDLIRQIESIDPGWKVPGGEPVFVEVATKKHLKISENAAGHIDVRAMIDKSDEPRELTLFFVMDNIFGRR